MSISSAELPNSRPAFGIAAAAWHSVLWLVIGNAIGVLLALLLLIPSLNPLLAEWTYGRWVMVHMNVMLYGWASLPMLGFLFFVYGVDRGPLGAWCRPILWCWSTALAVGALTWLEGHSSGKLFLDWSGYARVLLPFAMLALWLLLTVGFVREIRTVHSPFGARVAKAVGMLVLLAVPVALYITSSPALYPAFNPDTGGPTGTSQLESSLGVVVILLIIPFGIAKRNETRRWPVLLSGVVFCVETALDAVMPRADVSHHSIAQIVSLASVLAWIPLMPAYYGCFQWRPDTRRWRIAFLGWWSALVITGWIFFLPGVLDHFKFTDGLVGHSFVAMAGFLSALLIFVMVQLLGEGGWIFNRRWSFHLWNWSVVAYVLIVTLAGWFEGSDPAFTIVPGAARNVLYGLRLVSGALMFVASAEWLVSASALLRRFQPVLVHFERKKVA